MNNHGTGSMQKVVQKLFTASPLNAKTKRRILLKFATDETETILIQESSARRIVYAESLECVCLTRDILEGEDNKAPLFNAVQRTRKCLKNITEAHPRTTYPSTSAAYYAASAALSQDASEDKLVRDCVNCLLSVSLCVFNTYVDEYRFRVAAALEHATMDRQESDLRILLKGE